MTIEFRPWPKTPRFNRDVIITEKIDGTNAAIIIEESENPHDAPPASELPGAIARVVFDGDGPPDFEGSGVFFVGAQSRKRLIVPGDDNFGFAAWVAEHAEDLVRALGPGRHFGEWWGSGIQRGYDQPKGVKRFSLFNVDRYEAGPDLRVGELEGLEVVPTLYRGPLHDGALHDVELRLRNNGSKAQAGFMRPEGYVIFHSAANQVFKVLLEGDDTHKGDQA